MHDTPTEPVSFWIVLSGCLRIASSDADGDEFVYALLGPGSFFGLGSVVAHAPLGVAAYAYGATDVAAIDGVRFAALLDKSPGLWRHVAMLVIRDISSAPLGQRIVRRLVGQAVSHGAGPFEGESVALRDLARLRALAGADVFAF